MNACPRIVLISKIALHTVPSAIPRLHAFAFSRFSVEGAIEMRSMRSMCVGSLPLLGIIKATAHVVALQ